MPTDLVPWRIVQDTVAHLHSATTTLSLHTLLCYVRWMLGSLQLHRGLYILAVLTVHGHFVGFCARPEIAALGSTVLF